MYNYGTLIFYLHKRHYEKFADGSVKDIEDEIPFELPDGWEWARWGGLSESIQYGFNASARAYGRIKMVRISDIQDNGIVWDTVPYCDIAERNIERYLLKKNDILFARTGGTVGKSYLVDEVPEEAIYAGYLIRTRYSTNLSAKYLKFYMESELYWTQLHDGTIATAQPNCNGQTLSMMLSPLPPLTEQTRIVEAIETAFAQIDIIEKNKSDIEQLIKQAKAKVLDLAIHGKLVPQDPNDEPASVLLERIKAEKEKLIKQGKIKRDKKSAEVFTGGDNLYYQQIPFDVPENWAWCRGFNIFFEQGNTKPSGNEFNYIDIDSIDNNCHRVNKPKRLKTIDAPSRAIRSLSEGCIIFSMVRPYLENIALIDISLSNCIASSGFYVCNCKKIIDSKYMFYLMISKYVINGLNAYMKGDNSPSIGKNDIEKYLFPIPPLMEQIRMVAEIDMYIKLINIIAENLS